MDTWTWLVFGIALFALELFVSTGFYLFILGTACLVVGAGVFTGLVEDFRLQAALFSISAFVLWFFFAERLQRVLRSKEKEYTGMIGETAVARDVIVKGGKGGGEMWGSPWRLENVGSDTVNAGDECEVISSDGLVLKVKKKV
jgi:membrane protein implicated in regulation of membrane protease activity